MPVRPRTLRVFPNPWLYIDHRGRPAGACPCDPNEHTPDRRWVGATIGEAVLLQPAVTRVVAGAVQQIVSADHDIRWHYSGRVTLPNTGYYRDKIKKGEIFAADETTARESGLSKFMAPTEAIESARVAAIAEFDAANGKDAFEELGRQYAEDEEKRLSVHKLALGDTEPPAEGSKKPEEREVK